MRLLLSTKGLRVTSGERAYVERRLGFALGRFGDRIGLVRVRLTDLNGPKGGVDKRCLIALRVLPAQEVRVEATAPILAEAVDFASDRATWVIRRTLERMREPTGRRSRTRPVGRLR